jgi:hypothetical protein
MDEGWIPKTVPSELSCQKMNIQMTVRVLDG